MESPNHIHVSARAGTTTLTEQEFETVEKLLNKYFKGWITADGTQTWEGRIEKLKTYTVTRCSYRMDVSFDPFNACVNQLLAHCVQVDAFFMVEQGNQITHVNYRKSLPKDTKEQESSADTPVVDVSADVEPGF